MLSDSNITGPVNLGNPGEFTMIELANKVKAMIGSSSAIIHKSLPLDDPKQRKPDISMAKDQLGWEPMVNLEEGLEKTIAYFEQLLLLARQ
jgi:UDP-glucuronate decarboxylase